MEERWGQREQVGVKKIEKKRVKNADGSVMPCGSSCPVWHQHCCGWPGWAFIFMAARR